MLISQYRSGDVEEPSLYRGIRLQLRVDMFNAFNHQLWRSAATGINTNLDSSTFEDSQLPGGRASCSSTRG
jgi:hypothetical protein